jgi:mono/diheme cytochrome c family protein
MRMRALSAVAAVAGGFALALCAPASALDDDAPGAKVTFTKDVLPIFQQNCQICHRPGGANSGGMVAPMSFITYEDTRPWAKSIAKVVANRDMPPWDADLQHKGTFEEERILDETEIATIVNWVNAGAPQGDPADAPEPIAWPSSEGWVIGEPDMILTMPEPFFVPDELKDETKYFEMTIPEDKLPQDRWIKAVEFRPGSPAVHHIILSPFGGIAPGNAPLVYREGYSAKVQKGQKIVWNMHYNKEPGPGTGMWDNSSVGVKFYPEDYVPKHVLTTIPLGPMNFKIPAGEPNYAADATYTFRKDALINSMMPHMHYRGKRVLYELTYPDGKTETLLHVPTFDFNWQTAYRFKEPKPVPAGTKVKITGWWDNSKDNPFNPDPTVDVTWGEATHQEMLFGWISFTNVDEDSTAHQGIARRSVQ